MNNKKLISKLNIAFGIALLALAVVVFFVEPQLYALWINKKENAGLEGLAIIGIMALGFYGLIGFIIIGILNIISGIIIKKSNSVGKDKAWSIVSAIVDIISVVLIVYWLTIVFDLYSGGLITKVIYIIMALASLGLAILQIVSVSKKTALSEEVVTEEE